MRARTFLWLTLVCVLILATVQYAGYGGLGIVFALACAAAAGVLWALLVVAALPARPGSWDRVLANFSYRGDGYARRSDNRAYRGS